MPEALKPLTPEEARFVSDARLYVARRIREGASRATAWQEIIAWLATLTDDPPSRH